MAGQIEKDKWQEFCDDLSKTYHGYEARLEIIGRTFGDQEEAAWLPFSGLSYDPHHNHFFVTLGGISSHYPVHLSHTIDSPTVLHTREGEHGGITSVLIVNSDKTELLIHLRQQPRLASAD